MHRFESPVAILALLCASCSGGHKAKPRPAPAADGAVLAAEPAPEPAPESAPLRSRHAFARAMAQVEPGMSADRVRELLGEPDDVRTHYDPGGITAARTEEIWRYGTDGHLTFPTLGQVHMQADETVQYAFGGKGAPPPEDLFAEVELRRLLRVVDRLPSYNAGSGYDPLQVIRAVNALQPLGKDKALVVVAEYLRVSSWLDDAGREGVFLLLRALFEVPDPPGHMPVMMVGGPSPPAPADPKALPRFPLVIRGDIPFMLVTGYMLAGHAEQPERHLDYFREHGVLRAAPLRPVDAPLTLVDSLVGKAGTPFLQKTGTDNDWGRAHLMNQALLLVDTVYRTEPDAYGARLSAGEDIDARWRAHLGDFAKLRVRWDPSANRYSFADGSALPARKIELRQREIWAMPLRGTTEAKLVLERRNARYVDVEVRVTVSENQSMPAGTLRIVSDRDGTEIVKIDLPALGTASMSSSATWSISGGGSGIVHNRLVELQDGTAVKAELSAGKTRAQSPLLDP